MTITATVRQRLARFNGPRRNGPSGIARLQPAGAAASDKLASFVAWLGPVLGMAARVLAVVALWLAARLLWLFGNLVFFLFFWFLPVAAQVSARIASFCWWGLPRLIVAFRWVIVAAGAAIIVSLAAYDMRTSRFEAQLFTRLDRGLGYSVSAGASQAIQFPKRGPYDDRLGYTRLPQFVDSLLAHRYAIDRQAKWSPGLRRFVAWGGFPIYREKDQAGLQIFDQDGNRIYGTNFPGRAYPDFAAVPPVVAKTLSFIEDRYLLDPRFPEHNPAVEWKRFALAAAGRIGGLVLPGLHEGGGSTLATQIEKFRHSAQGMTTGVTEKLRQMVSASALAYADGPDTLHRRQQILVTYLNSTPLGSMPGYGEIIGVPEALHIWFGTDYNAATRILASTPRNAAELARQGVTYRQVLSLLLSERRPTYYLVTDRSALERLTDRYLRVLCDAGVIGPALRDAALAARLHFSTAPPPLAAISYIRQKATEDVRDKLVSLLKLPDLYSLDRLDLSVQTSVDTAAQQRVTAVLQQLGDPRFLRANGMVGKQLLGTGDPSKVTWSFVLYQRGDEHNFVRIHVDSLNKPFDINSGAKLMLGSTAKLRTLITYLDIMAKLHGRFASLSARQLWQAAKAAQDPLTEWAAGYLAKTRDRALQPMLEAAMQRTYSAAPGTFFTGGGVQSFGNFESSENYERPTVEIAFQHSINLAFVRLLHDIVTYYTADSGIEMQRVLDDPDDPQRQAYLRRFVDADSRHFLHQFYKDYQGLSGDQALELLAQRTRPIATRLATIYLSVHPDARLAPFQAFLTAHLPRDVITEDELWKLYLGYSPQKLNLADRGYVAGVHPLELWLVQYLQQHKGASWAQVVAASAEVRQQVYGWLFNGSMQKQDVRIRILMEQDAFNGILENWRALGYPFAHLVPSLGTAIGASGDRPDALARLMGIIMHDGVRVPTVTIQHLHFADGTPYQTDLSPAAEPERVMPVEVAQTVRQALMGVVADGTASRLRGAYKESDGSLLPVGGKTGTGDNRFDHFAVGGGITSSKVVDRTATFVFFLGDNFFGTVTAYVPSPDAAHFHFTSALAVQLLKVLEPELRPLIDTTDTKSAAATTASLPMTAP